MKTIFPPGSRLMTAVLIVFGTAIPGAWGRDIRSVNTEREQRPPLKLNVDRKPVDRTAADRVSYSPVVDQTAPSIVFVYSTKQV